jgi:hypothetical protein
MLKRSNARMFQRSAYWAPAYTAPALAAAACVQRPSRWLARPVVGSPCSAAQPINGFMLSSGRCGTVASGPTMMVCVTFDDVDLILHQLIGVIQHILVRLEVALLVFLLRGYMAGNGATGNASSRPAPTNGVPSLSFATNNIVTSVLLEQVGRFLNHETYVKTHIVDRESACYTR